MDNMIFHIRGFPCLYTELIVNYLCFSKFAYIPQ